MVTRRTKTVDPVDIERQLAEHEAAIEKLRRDLTPPTTAQKNPTPPPAPSALALQLAAKQERNRLHRVEQNRIRVEAEAAAYEADAPRRAKVEAELAENDEKLAAARAELNRLEWERGQIRRTL